MVCYCVAGKYSHDRVLRESNRPLTTYGHERLLLELYRPRVVFARSRIAGRRRRRHRHERILLELYRPRAVPVRSSALVQSYDDVDRVNLAVLRNCLYEFCVCLKMVAICISQLYAYAAVCVFSLCALMAVYSVIFHALCSGAGDARIKWYNMDPIY